MDATSGAAQEKADFFAASMHMVHITGFPRRQSVLVRPVHAPDGARLDVWRTDPDDERHISGPSGGSAAFSTRAFSVANSGNRTLRAPKRSWKVRLEPGEGGGRLAAGPRQPEVDVQRSFSDA